MRQLSLDSIFASDAISAITLSALPQADVFFDYFHIIVLFRLLLCRQAGRHFSLIFHIDVYYY